MQILEGACAVGQMQKICEKHKSFNTNGEQRAT